MHALYTLAESDMADDKKYNVIIGLHLKVKGSENAATRTINEFITEVMAGKMGYEALYDEIAPVYDYDDKVTLEDFARVNKEAFETNLKVLREMWGEKATIIVLTSSGMKKSDKYTGPVISYRYIIRGVGKFPCGAQMKAAGKIPQGVQWDRSIYGNVGSRKLMRVWGASKEGEDRPMKMWIGDNFKTLKEIYTADPDLATTLFRTTLAQYVRGEPEIEVKCEEPAKMLIDLDKGIIAIGKNGEALGRDIDIKCPGDIEELTNIAGWDKQTWEWQAWCDNMWLLRNTANEYGVDLRELAHKISSKSSKYIARETDKQYDTSQNRALDNTRKTLGMLRKEAKDVNSDAYVLWMDRVKKPVPVDPTDGEERMIYIDHNKFVKKTISLKLAMRWAREALVYVENKGTPYMLTRNMETCKYTNRPVEVWGRSKHADLLAGLNTTVYIKYQDDELEKKKKAIEVKQKAGGKVTKEDTAILLDACRFTNFGWGSKEEPGFAKYMIQERVMPVVSHEDFIPYLARRIPDKHIAAAVADKMTLNVFRGFPVETIKYDASKPQYLESRLHHHLRDIICHGDLAEYEHFAGTIADMIQRPYRVSNVAHVFHGRQGVGKSFLLQFMRQLIGVAHVMEFDDINTYFRNFNEDHSQAILKVMEEVSDKGEGFINNGKLKAEITKVSIRIEIKNAAIIHMRNCARLWFISNNRNTLHVEHDDRRYTYHEVSDKYADSREYFDPLWALLEDDEFIRACFEHFAELSYDEGKICRAHTTAYKEEQKIKSMPLPMKFLNDLMVSDFDACDHDGDKVASTAFFNAYGIWAGPSNTFKRSGPLADKLAEMGIAKPTQQHMNGVRNMAYILNKDEVREKFRLYLKMPTFDFVPAGHI